MGGDLRNEDESPKQSNPVFLAPIIRSGVGILSLVTWATDGWLLLGERKAQAMLVFWFQSIFEVRLATGWGQLLWYFFPTDKLHDNCCENNLPLSLSLLDLNLLLGCRSFILG